MRLLAKLASFTLALAMTGAPLASFADSTPETPEQKAHRETMERLAREIELAQKQAALLQAQLTAAQQQQALKKQAEDLAAQEATSAAAAAAAVKKADEEALAKALSNESTKVDILKKQLEAIGSIGVDKTLKDLKSGTPTLKMPATALAEVFNNASELAKTTAQSISSRLAPCGPSNGSHTLVLWDTSTRSALLAYRSTLDVVRVRDKELKARSDALETYALQLGAWLEGQKPEPIAAPLEFKSFMALPGGLLTGLQLASQITESALTVAAATKRAYAVEKVDGVADVDSWFRARVQSGLSSVLVDPSRLITSGLTPSSEASLLAELANVASTVDTTRVRLGEFTALSVQARAQWVAPDEEKPGAKRVREARLAQLSKMEQASTDLKTYTDLVSKLVTDLLDTATAADSKLELALRGEHLHSLALNDCTVFLDLNLRTAQIDMVASDSLFGGLRMAAGGTFSATWRLIKPNGVIVAQGAEGHQMAFKQIAADAFKKPDEWASPKPARTSF